MFDYLLVVLLKMTFKLFGLLAYGFLLQYCTMSP